MRRHPDARRLATMVRRGEPLDEPGRHRTAAGPLPRRRTPRARRRRAGQADAVAARWQESGQLASYARGRVPSLDPPPSRKRPGSQGFHCRAISLFDRRIAGGRIVDGHADLLADDIFCMPGPSATGLLGFDDRLRYVDVADDLAFLAMDLEFLGRPDLAEVFANRYAQFSGDDAPVALRHFYIAYRAGVRGQRSTVSGTPRGAPSRHSTPSATSTSH